MTAQVPPNPFDNPEFRSEFQRTLQPLTAAVARHDSELAEHGRQLSFIKGAGAIISALLSVAIWCLRTVSNR